MFKYKKLGQISYHLVKKRSDLKPFLSKWLLKEWQQDYEKFPDQQWTIDWLNQINKVEFKLKTINLDEINLHKDLLEYNSESYSFIESLKKRVEEMEDLISQGSSIGPLIVNKTNMELMDGYTRYMILKKYKQRKVYVYLGYLK